MWCENCTVLFWCGCSRTKTDQYNYLLYMDDLKLLGRNENDLNEIKIVHTINKDLNMHFGL